MIIRQPKESDIPFLRRLLTQLGYPAQNESKIRDGFARHATDGYHLMIAEMDQEVVGFIALHWFDLFHRDEKLGRISAFCVDERCRGMGIGIKLLEATEIFLRSKGCGRIEVTSNIRRAGAHQYYLNRGYAEESKRFVKNISLS